MTLDQARLTAKAEAAHFGKGFLIYRLTAWTADTYGVRSADQLLPLTAAIIERVDPDGSTASANVVLEGRLF
jgi:hypothetical protein